MSERYEGVVLLGEVTGETALRRAPEYTQGGGLDMAYTFDLLLAPPDANGIRAVVERLEASIGQGWMCWSFGNHDIIRAATRFGGADCPLGLRRLIPILLCSMRGTLCLYQGEELGLDEAELAFEDLRDPYGIAFWPEFKGRDGCRTPMPWRHDQAHGAFTTGRPWLPLPPSHLSRAVDLQEGRHGSVLATTRRFLHWRRDCRPLREGSMAFLEADPAILAFERSLSGERVIAVFNMSPTDQRFAAAGLGPAGFATDGVELAQGSLNLPAFGLGFLRPCA
jgi:alpha-glucosidase